MEKYVTEILLDYVLFSCHGLMVTFQTWWAKGGRGTVAKVVLTYIY